MKVGDALLVRMLHQRYLTSTDVSVVRFVTQNGTIMTHLTAVGRFAPREEKGTANISVTC